MMWKKKYSPLCQSFKHYALFFLIRLHHVYDYDLDIKTNNHKWWFQKPYEHARGWTLLAGFDYFKRVLDVFFL